MGTAGSAGEWNVRSWATSLDLASDVERALQSALPSADHFKFLCKPEFTWACLSHLLDAAQLAGHAQTIWTGINELRTNAAATGAELNEKFAQSGAFEMDFGSLDRFFGGLESLLGPPVLLQGSIKRAMEHNHCSLPDHDVSFSSSNNLTSTPQLEWEFVASPDVHSKQKYPQRIDVTSVREKRQVKALHDFQPEMDRVNGELRSAGQDVLIEEELIAGRLYTGPMYEKYNGVLRGCSGQIHYTAAEVADLKSNAQWPSFVRQKCVNLKLGTWEIDPSTGSFAWRWINQYGTTIHAINSCVIKLSKVVKSCKVWRGVAGARLPPDFFNVNDFGVCGGTCVAAIAVVSSPHLTLRARCALPRRCRVRLQQYIEGLGAGA